MEEKNTLYNLNVDFTNYETRITSKFKKRKAYNIPDVNKLNAFIPGIITNVFVKEGQHVKRGDVVLILEAMKMKNNVSSHKDGKIKKIFVSESKMVNKNETLIEFE